MRKILVISVAVVAILLAACSGTPAKNSAQSQAQDLANDNNSQIYVQKNNIEFNNYNARQKLADNPAQIIWCTFAWNTVGSPLVTVPVLGKLTSGAKRPYPTEQVANNKDSGYFPELPGPDGMYGSSGDYRYGFQPDGNYVDFTGIPTFCTSSLTSYQKENTVIVQEKK